jgi:hypothetical protein
MLGSGLDHRGVVIAEQRHGAARHMFHHGFDDKDRIGAVAHIVAQKHEPVDPAAARMVEAGREGLTVAVDVGEQRDAHRSGPRRPHAATRAAATFL